MANAWNWVKAWVELLAPWVEPRRPSSASAELLVGGSAHGGRRCHRLRGGQRPGEPLGTASRSVRTRAASRSTPATPASSASWLMRRQRRADQLDQRVLSSSSAGVARPELAPTMAPGTATGRPVMAWVATVNPDRVAARAAARRPLRPGRRGVRRGQP